MGCEKAERWANGLRVRLECGLLGASVRVLWGVVSGRSSHGFASVARASGFYHIERSGSA